MLLQKFVVGCTWFFLILAVIFHVYSVVTVFERSECYTCTNQKTRVPWFVWYTSWCLWFTLASWIFFSTSCWTFSSSCCLNMKRKTTRNKQGNNAGATSAIDDNHHKSSSQRLSNVGYILLGISTPWSVTVTLSYTYYLVTGDLGRDYVDQDLCFTISDSAIPRTKERALAILFLVLDRIVNITIHFACAIVNLIMTYFILCHDDDDDDSSSRKMVLQHSSLVNVGQIVEEEEAHGTHTGSSTFIPQQDEVNHSKNGELHDAAGGRNLKWWLSFLVLPVSCYIALSIIIGMVHTFVDQVYCTDNIWVDTSLSCAVFIVICMVRLFIIERFGNKNRNKRNNDRGRGVSVRAVQQDDGLENEKEKEEEYGA